MSRTHKKIIGSLVMSIVVAAVMVPSASGAYDLGVAEVSSPSERTATELNQAVGEPGDQGSAAAKATYSRTPTELAQTVTPPATANVASGGFDWGDAAIGAGTVLGVALLGFAAVAFNNRRRRIGGAEVPLASS